VQARAEVGGEENEMSETEAGASYVVGFMFNPMENAVLLLRKNRPSWQVGKLNGIGGRIENGESPIQAMRRECIEEVGIAVDSWSEFCVLSDERGWEIHFLSAVGPILNASAITDEKPEVVSVFELPFDVIPNLKWLIPMALSMRFERIDYFDVRERQRQPALI
jgi:8-oxo-dGTP diphosphatase